MLVRGRSLWKNGRRMQALSFPHPRDRSVFSGALYACFAPAASPQPDGRRRSDWSERGSGREFCIPPLSTDALRPYDETTVKTALEHATKFIQNPVCCSCWRSLTSLISMLRPTFVRNSHDDAQTSFSSTLSSRLDELQDGNWWPECLCSETARLVRLVASLLFYKDD